jgi:hypothetical protein
MLLWGLFVLYFLMVWCIGIISAFLLNITNIRVDVPVSRPVLVAWGRINDLSLEENTHSHHRQHRVPGLHAHSIPCLWSHLCSIGPHSFVLKNTSLCLVITAPITLFLRWWRTFCSEHLVTHTEEVTQSLCTRGVVMRMEFRIKTVACTMQDYAYQSITASTLHLWHHV